MSITGALALAAAIAAAPTQAACGGHNDFLVRSDPTLAPVRPPDCSSVAQSPPEFTWPPQEGENTYQVLLKFPDGRVEARTTKNNWLLWDAALAPGTYTWQVRVSGATNELGEPRRFTIERDATRFVLPSPSTILVKARSAPRPRTWPHDADNPLPSFRSTRAHGFKALLATVGDNEKRRIDEPVSKSSNSNYDDAVEAQKRTLAAALAWAATHDLKYGADAAERIARQARWSTSGPTSYSANDMANRTVAWTLALGYDWTYDYLSAEQKRAILAAIRARVQPMFADNLKKITAYPYDSHGNITLNIVAAIGVLMAGDIPEADEWVKQAVPAAVAWTSPWGWQDGGFANGTAQGFWDTGSNLLAWYVLRNGAGIDVARKEWVRNHERFLAYFVPPGAPSGAFGDGLEMPLTEVWSRVGKALAAFVPTPIGRWYAASENREDDARIELLLAPPAEFGRAQLPPGTPDSAWFPSVGWVAMHSSLADHNRTSVFFKSSPYGSYNHSHADQNSFVVNARGRRLAIASGYYDDYGTAHWKDWYKQTRAANAITFDGGQGQGYHDKAAAGEVTRFGSGNGYDYAIGRAEKAYQGKLSLARRAIVYLRPDIVIVHDELASETPRSWEWNIHAVNRMQAVSPTHVTIRNGPAQMCVEMVSAPEVEFAQGDQFTARPSSGANQWHGSFTTLRKSPSAEFVVVMHVGRECGARAADASQATARRDGEAMDVQVAGRHVRFAGETVEVR